MTKELTLPIQLAFDSWKGTKEEFKVFEDSLVNAYDKLLDLARDRLLENFKGLSMRNIIYEDFEEIKTKYTER